MNVYELIVSVIVSVSMSRSVRYEFVYMVDSYK